MGKEWDGALPSAAIWAECLRVLKPGGHLLSFAGSRTYHRMAVRIEDAGFEIRDQLMWLYGSGFPKTGNLKPAHEPIVMARKPFKGSQAACVAAHGTGKLNVEACRVPFVSEEDEQESKGKNQHADHGNGARSNAVYNDMGQQARANYDAPGRWPANVIHDGCDCVVELFPQSSVTGKRKKTDRVQQEKGATDFTRGVTAPEYTDSGSAARYFYCAKPSPAERHRGLSNPGPQFKHGATLRDVENTDTKGNNHPTVKPIALMEHLIQLVTPAGGLVLDPFMGSGTTGIAAARLGFQFWGVEKDRDFFRIGHARIEYEVTHG
ncbi:TPA: site-specific DNA-methyltransferase [Enterobacter cloacae]